MDAIGYIEHWVNGVKVNSTVKVGDVVDVRVVYNVAASGGYHEVSIRRGSGTEVKSGQMARTAGDYYVSFPWTVTETPGQYNLTARIYWNDGTGLRYDEKFFTEIVTGVVTPPPWWEQFINMIPGGWLTIGLAGGLTAVIVVSAVILTEEKGRIAKMMRFKAR